MKLEKQDILLFLLVVIAGILAMIIFCQPTPIDETPEYIEEDYIEPVETKKDYVYIFEATAYCPCEVCCDEWSDGITYTGTKATEGRTIAVDPKVIPLGTKVVIDGNEYIAEDIGGGVNGYYVDIFFNSHDDALKFGRRYVEIHLEEVIND